MPTRKRGFHFDTYIEDGSFKVGLVIGYEAYLREATVWLSFFRWKIIAWYYFGAKDGGSDDENA